MVIFNSYVKLPEGILQILPVRLGCHLTLPGKIFERLMKFALANRRWLCYCVGPRIDLGLNNPMVYQFPHTGFLWFFVWKLVPGRNFFVWVYPIFKHTQNSYYVHHIYIYIMHIFLNDIHIPIILPWYTRLCTSCIPTDNHANIIL